MCSKCNCDKGDSTELHRVIIEVKDGVPVVAQSTIFCEVILLIDGNRFVVPASILGKKKANFFHE
jgi:hypothetical protein